MPGMRPFELSLEELEQHLEKMVDATFSDIASEFLLMPAGNAFIKYPEFRDAYEVLKRQTNAFQDFTAAAVQHALIENARVLGVLRAILGMTAPEWGELARSELNSDVTQGATRTLDRRCREDLAYIKRAQQRYQAALERAHNRNQTPPEQPKSLCLY